MLAFTDGVTEAMNEQSKDLRQGAVRQDTWPGRRSNRDAGERARGGCRDFAGDGPIRDDTCIVGFQRAAP